MIYTKSDFSGLAQRFRTNLINSVSGFKSANLIGTTDSSGKTNLAVFSSVIHLGADPAAVGLLMRPVTVDRHTYQNIKETGYFTVNHIHRHIIERAHQTSARYDKDISEFDACLLTPEFSAMHPAPYVKESQIKFACTFTEEHTIRLNGTIFIAGEIIELMLPGEYIQDDGYIDIEAADTVTISGLDSYHSTKRECRLPYAKPGKDTALLR